MKTKSPKEPKQPKSPRQSEATIGQMVAWLDSCEKAKLKAPALRLAAEVEAWKSHTAIYDAPWAWRKWIEDFLYRVRHLPHTEVLQIKDMRKVFIESRDRSRMKKAAEFMKLRLHHINFQYFTMPCR